jgi:AraC-like DNA-binding protein
MYVSLMPRICREERFRTPSPAERAVGLWVDRIGQDNQSFSVPPRLRILGQYAAVALLTGSGVFEGTDGSPTPVRAGDVILLFPTVPARYYPQPEWSSVWIVWNGAAATALETLGFLSPDRPIVTNAADLAGHAHSALVPLMRQEDRGAVLRRKLIVDEMLLALFQRARADGAPRRAEERIGQAVRILNAPGGDRLQLPELARRVNLSPAHFRRLFREVTGTNPKTFQQTVRINRAKELLTQGDSIKATAATLGYRDVFHFMRAFRRITHLPPGQFRARQQPPSPGT